MTEEQISKMSQDELKVAAGRTGNIELSLKEWIRVAKGGKINV